MFTIVNLSLGILIDNKNSEGKKSNEFLEQFCIMNNLNNTLLINLPKGINGSQLQFSFFFG